MGSGFRDKIVIFGHAAWSLTKDPEVAQDFTHGVEIELIFSVRAAVSEIQAKFENCHVLA